MKKFFILSLVGLLFFAFGSVYAQEKAPTLEFKPSGTIWFTQQTHRNASGAPSPTSDAWNHTNAYLESRGRIKFDMAMEKDLSGTIYFEMDSSRWGDPEGTRNAMGRWDADRAAVEVKNVFINVGVPFMPVPTSVKIGLQTIAIRPNLFLFNDGMGVTANIKVDPVTIMPLWFKAVEGTDNNSDDVDLYGLHVNAKVDQATVGGYGVYWNMQDYPLRAATMTQRCDAWWLGAYMDGKLDPVNLNFDFVYDNAKVETRATGADVKYSGWVTRLKVDYPWEKFNFGVVGLYATGDDKNKTDKKSGYVVSPNSWAGPGLGESQVFYSSEYNQGNTGIAVNSSATEITNPGFGGTWFAKLYGSLKATPWYKVTLQGLYIGDTVKNGDAVGTMRNSDGTLKDNKAIGWEFDLLNEFQLYKNLVYQIGAGFMLPDDGLKFYDSATGTNKKPKTPWGIGTNLQYNF